MSDTLYPALQVQNQDPAKPFGEWAQVAQSQAATQGQQIQNQGGQLQNQLTALRYGLQLPGSSQGGGAPQNALAGINPGAGQSGAGGPGDPAFHGVVSGPGTQISPFAVSSPVGALPPQAAVGAFFDKDQTTAWKTALETKRQVLSQILQQSTPETWQQSVGAAYQAGYLTPQEAQTYAANPASRQQFMNAMASPESNVSLQGQGLRQGVVPDGQGGWQPSSGVVAAKGAGAAAVSGAQAQNKTVEVTVPDGGKDAQGNPTYRTQVMTQAQAAQMASGNGGAKPTSAADYANPAISIGADAFAARVTGRESGNNQSAAATGSSAAGGAQFTDGTWLDQVKSQRPDLAQGRTDAQILAMRTDTSPAGTALMSQITQGYAQQNAAALSKSGIPVNAMTLGLAHQFGATGVASVLQAPPNTQISKVVSPDAMKANPQFAGKTVGDVTADAFKAYGVNPVQFGGQGQAQQAQAPGIPGAPVQTPQQKAALDVQTSQTKAVNDANVQEIATTAKAYGEQAGDILKAGNNAPVALQRLDVIQNAAAGFRPGASADTRLGAMKTLTDLVESAGGTVPDWLKNGAASGETIGKEGGYLAAQMTKALGSREAASVFQAVQGIQPNIKMSDGGFQVIVNSLRQGALRDQDLKNYQETWLADPSHNNSIRGMTSSFEQSHPVEAYASRVMPYQMPASKDQAKPNVVYQTKQGPMVWNGRGFVVASAQ